jgi:hypothetical protein
MPFYPAGHSSSTLALPPSFNSAAEGDICLAIYSNPTNMLLAPLWESKQLF